MATKLLLLENFTSFFSTAKPNSLYKITSEKGNFIFIKRYDKAVVLKDECPHLSVPLSQSGVLNVFGDLVCKEHGHCFSIKTGQGCDHKNEYLKIYETEIENDSLYINLI